MQNYESRALDWTDAREVAAISFCQSIRFFRKSSLVAARLVQAEFLSLISIRRLLRQRTNKLATEKKEKNIGANAHHTIAINNNHAIKYLSKIKLEKYLDSKTNKTIINDNITNP